MHTRLAWVTLLSFLLVPSLVSSQNIRSMKLLNADAGWAASDKRLSWTSDGGRTWKDITPTTTSGDSITSVFFLDAATGWALLSQYAEPEPRFDLAATTDAGTHWSVTTVSIPGLNTDATTLSGDGRITFVDRTHGWINLGVVSSPAFRLAALLATSDGGKTWNLAPGGAGTGGDIAFISPDVGWVAGGPGGEKLYVTYDGAASWQELSLLAPPQVHFASESTIAVYGVPMFQDSKNGFLPVTYTGPEGSGLTLALFSSSDGGHTWKADRTLGQLPGTYAGIPFPATIADSLLIVAYVADRTYLTLTTVAADGKASSERANVLPPDSGVDSVSFSSAHKGWVLVGGKLLSTADGGSNWIDITPPKTPEKSTPHSQSPFPTNSAGRSLSAFF